MMFEQISNKNCIDFLPTGFDTFAEIVKTGKGAMRLIYNGIGFGRKCGNKDGVTWQCTKTKENTTHHRCTATVRTTVMNGYEMVRANNTKHTCTEYKNGYAKPKNKENSKKSKKWSKIFDPFHLDGINKPIHIIQTTVLIFHLLCQANCHLSGIRYLPVDRNTLQILQFRQIHLILFLIKIGDTIDAIYKYFIEIHSICHSFQSGFDGFAEMVTEKRGVQRIIFRGLKYGKHKDMKDFIVWRCTKQNINHHARKCNACIQTKVIDGYTMVKLTNPLHQCRHAFEIKSAPNYIRVKTNLLK